MSVLYFESELYHYGVKGMKWGVRRSKENRGSVLKSYSHSKHKKTDKLPYGTGLPDDKTTSKAGTHVWLLRSALYTSGNKISKKSFDELHKKLLDLDVDVETLRNVNEADRMVKESKKWLNKSKENKIKEIHEWYQEHGPGPEEEPKTRKAIDMEIGYWDTGAKNEYTKSYNFLKNKGGYDSAKSDLERRINEGVNSTKTVAKSIGITIPSESKAIKNWDNIEKSDKR